MKLDPEYVIILLKQENGIGEQEMKLNQEAKSMIAMTALVGAIIVALNEIVLPASDRGMIPWSVGLLAVAVLVWVWMRRDALASKSTKAAHSAEEAANQAEALAKRVELKEETVEANADDQAEQTTPDDLTQINGIGPVYQTVLNQAGVHNYQQLAAMSVPELEAIFEAAQRSRPPQLETWSPQAGFAADGNWDGLRQYQNLR